MKSDHENEQMHQVLENLLKTFQVVNPNIISLIYDEKRELVFAKTNYSEEISIANVRGDSIGLAIYDCVAQLKNLLS